MAKRQKTTRATKVKDLASLPQIVSKDDLPAGQQATTTLVPTLGPSMLCATQNMGKFKEDVNVLLVRVQEYGRDIGQALRSQDVEYQLESIFQHEDKVATTINEVTNSAARRDLARAYMLALLENIPHTRDGLNHLADQGLVLGLFSEAPSGTGGSFKLPVTVERGQKWTTLRVPHGEEPIYSKIKPILDALRAAHMATRESELTELKSDASMDLLATLEEGGEAVFFVPDSRDGDRFLAGGWVRVAVEDGQTSPVAAVGKCRRWVASGALFGISIPVSSLLEDKIDMAAFGFVDPKDKFLAFVVFHGLCRRGYLYALRGQEIRAARTAMEERATTSAADFVLRDMVGIAYVFVKTWQTEARTFKGVCALVERNDSGELRVAECPEHLGELFSKCREFASPERVEYPLGQMLKKLSNVLSRAEARKEKEDGGEPDSKDATGVLPVGDDREEFTARR